MEGLDRRTQLIAVANVKKEMRLAEEFLKKWNVSWWEQLLDAHCMELHTEIAECDVQDMERKYNGRYKLANAYYSGKSIGVPLVTETLVGNDLLAGIQDRKFNVEFGKVEWTGMNSKKSSRELTFVNDGTIEINKHGKGDLKSTSYSGSFNVLSDDFSLKIWKTKDIMDGRNLCGFNRDTCSISLKDRVLTDKMNNIEISRYLGTGRKVVRIIKKYDRSNKVSVVFEAGFDLDNVLEYGAIAINTHKGNGKVNGTYRFDFSLEKGVRANFYSRKGNKIDISNDPEILYLINLVIAPILCSEKIDDMIIMDFIGAIYAALGDRTSTIDFDVEHIGEAEKEIVDTVKGIRSEIPLRGLTNRINDSLSAIGAQSIKPAEKGTCKVREEL